jgi:hypothetical protein
MAVFYQFNGHPLQCTFISDDEIGIEKFYLDIFLSPCAEQGTPQFTASKAGDTPEPFCNFSSTYFI